MKKTVINIALIVTTIIIFLGMFFVGQALLPLLNSPVLAPGFANVTPAILGATAVPALLGNKKLSVVPVILSLVAYFIIGAKFGMYQSYVLIIVMVLSVGSAYINYKKSK